MFGVVPKPLWEKQAPADDRNRIPLAMRPLLVRGARHDDHRRRARRQRWTRSSTTSTASIARDTSITRWRRPGCRADDIDIVLASHLHFDHAGGFTVRDAIGRVRPALSRARSTSSGAASGRMRRIRTSGTAPAICADNFVPLADAGVLQLVDDDATIMPGVRVRRTGGHTHAPSDRDHRVGRQDGGVRRRPDADDGAPAGRRGSWATTCIRWTRSRSSRRSCARRSSASTLVFFEHDPAIAAGYIREENGKRRVEPRRSDTTDARSH